MTSGKLGSNPSKQFICEFCGNPFKRKVCPSSRATFEFCSPTCRNKARSLPLIPCPICGEMFKPQVHMTGNRRKKHCSNECANQARRGMPSPKRTPLEIRQAIAAIYPTQGPEPLMEMFGMKRASVQQLAYNEGVKLESRRVTKICKRCGKPFETFKCRVKQVYCSRECSKRQITVVCAVCGKEFSVPKCRQDVWKYCSKTCGREGRKRPKQTCEWCGKEYQPNKAGRRFCRLQCAADSRKATRLHKSCETCGKEFIVKKGYAHARFCSMKCSAIGIAVRGPDNPNWKGGHDSYRGPNWLEQAALARQRDMYTCQMCELVRVDNPKLPVHHIISYREFNNEYEAANVLTNLVTLCKPCHRRVEMGKIPCPVIKVALAAGHD